MSKTESAKFTVSVKAATKKTRQDCRAAAAPFSQRRPSVINEMQVSGIKNAIAALDRGEADSHEKVREWVLSWDSQQEHPIPRPLISLGVTVRSPAIA